MRRYDIVLLDADNTLFDFDAAEAQALAAVLAEFGWPREEGTKRAYLEINRALWSAFDRGRQRRTSSQWSGSACWGSAWAGPPTRRR